MSQSISVPEGPPELQVTTLVDGELRVLGGLTSGAVPWWHGVCLVLPKLVAEPAGSSCRVSGSEGHVRQRRWRIGLENRQRKTSEWLRTSFEPARAGQWFGQTSRIRRPTVVTGDDFFFAVQQKRSQRCLGECEPHSVPSSGFRKEGSRAAEHRRHRNRLRPLQANP